MSIHEKRSILLFIFPKEKRGLAADPATIIYLKHIIYLCMRFFLPAVYMSSYTRIGCSLIWRTACCTGFKSSAAVLVAKHFPFRQERTAVSYPLLWSCCVFVLTLRRELLVALLLYYPAKQQSTRSRVLYSRDEQQTHFSHFFLFFNVLYCYLVVHVEFVTKAITSCYLYTNRSTTFILPNNKPHRDEGFEYMTRVLPRNKTNKKNNKCVHA